LKRSEVKRGQWREFMEVTYPHMEDDIRDMEHWSNSWSVTELMENNDADGIVEIVGDQASAYTEDDDIWSDFCMLFYDWWGCIDLASGTAEWDAFWEQRLAEEQDSQ